MKCLYAECQDNVCLWFSPVRPCGTLSLLKLEAAHKEAAHNQLSVIARPPVCLPACLCVRAAVGILKLLFSEQQTYQRVVLPAKPLATHTLKIYYTHNSEAYKAVLKALYCCKAVQFFFWVMLFLYLTQCRLQILKHAVSPPSVSLKRKHAAKPAGCERSDLYDDYWESFALCRFTELMSIRRLCKDNQTCEFLWP